MSQLQIVSMVVLLSAMMPFTSPSGVDAIKQQNYDWDEHGYVLYCPCSRYGESLSTMSY